MTIFKWSRVFAGRANREAATKRADRIQYKPLVGRLESKTLRSQVSIGAPQPGDSLVQVRQSLPGSAEITHMNVAAKTNMKGDFITTRTSYVVPASVSSKKGGGSVPSGATIANSNGSGKLDSNYPSGVELVVQADSGKLDPKDPSGVELVMQADSGKLDPKDPGGVELVMQSDSEKLDPKDSGGVELGWVDRAVVGRLSGL
jgi:hypothetical protein